MTRKNHTRTGAGLTGASLRGRLCATVFGMALVVGTAGAIGTAAPAPAFADTSGTANTYSNSDGNIFRRWWVSAVRAVTGSSDSERPSPVGSFSDLQELEYIHVRAAGWNGDPFYQFLLGQIFAEGREPVQRNYVAAYFWYSLSAAQGYEPASVQRDAVFETIGAQLVMEAYQQFLETYLYGGPEAHYRLGYLHEVGGFFDDHLADVEAYQRDKLKFAYAAYLLSYEGGYPKAYEALQRVGKALRQVDLDMAKAIAADWRRKVEGGDDAGFGVSPKDAQEAIERGSGIQQERGKSLSKADQARSYLKAGEAYLVRGKIGEAKINFEKAISTAPNSRAALEAQQALQGLTTTCSAAPDEYPRPAEHPLNKVREIDLKSQQRALSSLGYYTGPIDGIPGPQTRFAVNRFLDSLNMDVRDFLTDAQVVELVCKAAQLRGNAPSQNLMGVLYTHGIGVYRNYDLALYWFGRAAEQREPSAILNMGKMYANGWGVPEHPQNAAIARSYFLEAKQLGHPGADAELRKLRRLQQGYRPH